MRPVLNKKGQKEKSADKTVAPVAAHHNSPGDLSAPAGMPLYLKRDVRSSANPDLGQLRMEEFEKPAQPKLEISQPQDPFEQEADGFAELIANSHAAPAINSNA